MNYTRFFRHPGWTKAHRWLTLIIGLQVTAWVVGGAVFVWSDLDNVHGDYEVREAQPPVLAPEILGQGASRAVAALEKSLGRSIEPRRILLTHLLDAPVYRVYEKGGVPAGLVDARTFGVISPLGREAVAEIARGDYKPDHPIRSVLLLDEKPVEYRGSEWPVWQVAFESPKGTRLYISPLSGGVLARRNRNWRIFDFFWMLHTMDYRGRDDFNHALIRAASVGAGLVLLTGILLLFQRFLPQRRRS